MSTPLGGNEDCPDTKVCWHAAAVPDFHSPADLYQSATGSVLLL